MHPIWHRLELWECVKAGMYESFINEQIVNKCIELFKSDNLFDKMYLICNKWKYSAEVNLSQTACNRRAWVGQAVCCYCVNANVEETTAAWVQLTRRERDGANNCADMAIKKWERKGEPILKYIQIQMF